MALFLSQFLTDGVQWFFFRYLPISPIYTSPHLHTQNLLVDVCRPGISAHSVPLYKGGPIVSCLLAQLFLCFSSQVKGGSYAIWWVPISFKHFLRSGDLCLFLCSSSQTLSTLVFRQLMELVFIHGWWCW